MIDDFDNMTDEEFEIICEELLPTQKEAFNLIKEQEPNGTITKEDTE